MREACLRFREAGLENIKTYCKNNDCNNEFDLIKNHLMDRADEYNLKLPVDYYRDFYKLTVELLNDN